MYFIILEPFPVLGLDDLKTLDLNNLKELKFGRLLEPESETDQKPGVVFVLELDIPVLDNANVFVLDNGPSTMEFV